MPQAAAIALQQQKHTTNCNSVGRLWWDCWQAMPFSMRYADGASPQGTLCGERVNNVIAGQTAAGAVKGGLTIP